MNKRLTAWTLPLRPWQEELYGTYLEKLPSRFMVVAAPGSGKTIALLRLIHALLQGGNVQRVVVVVPTDHLKTQWRKAAEQVGIFLQEDWQPVTAERETADFHGIVLTYQHLQYCALHIRAQCGRIPTLVVLDEIHHLGHTLEWGDKTQLACGPARAHLVCSGTPFRSDNHRIPFVEYDATGKSVADYSYSYGRGLSDGILRPILFPTYEGQMRWISDGEEFCAQFADELPEAEARRRLRTALDIEGNWLPSVLAEADHRLSLLREDDNPRAGGLVVAIDTDHAREITKKLPDAIMVCYEDPDASERISRFANGTGRWLVSVRMVSEGVDIPRLRVAVYATNIISELFFRQLAGRISRGDDAAYLYIPADEDLLKFARALKEERDHELEEELSRERAARPDDGPRVPLDFLKLSAEAQAAAIIYDGEEFSADELYAAREWATANGGWPATFPIEILARILRRVGASPRAHISANPEAPTVAPHALRRDLRRLCNRLVPQVAITLGCEPKDINYRLIERTGVSIASRTVEQLEECVSWLKGQLVHGRTA